MNKSGVLLIEDDRDLADVYQTKFIKAGHRLYMADRAQAALDQLDENQIDLILLDLMLPRNSGLSVLYEVRSYSDWRRIPVIILSNLSPRDAKLTPDILASLNVEQYLVKSEVKPGAIVAAVEEVLGS